MRWDRDSINPAYLNPSPLQPSLIPWDWQCLLETSKTFHVIISRNQKSYVFFLFSVLFSVLTLCVIKSHTYCAVDIITPSSEDYQTESYIFICGGGGCVFLYPLCWCRVRHKVNGLCFMQRYKIYRIIPLFSILQVLHEINICWSFVVDSLHRSYILRSACNSRLINFRNEMQNKFIDREVSALIAHNIFMCINTALYSWLIN